MWVGGAQTLATLSALLQVRSRLTWTASIFLPKLPKLLGLPVLPPGQTVSKSCFVLLIFFFFNLIRLVFFLAAVVERQTSIVSVRVSGLGDLR